MELTALGTLHFQDGQPLAAASGLVVNAQGLWVIGDDLLHLGHFRAPNQRGRRLRLLPGTLPLEAKARKRVKPDFEMLLAWRGGLLAMGSGSLPTRELAVFLPGGGGEPQAFSLAPLYALLRQELGVLNLEGALLQQGVLSLLQRANAGGPGNVRVQMPAKVLDALLAGDALPKTLHPAWQRIALGLLDGVPLGFTDACALPGGHWLYSAAAEASPDAVADGACSGSVIGLADAQGAVLAQQRVPGRLKVEGLAAQRWPGGAISLAMVCDADDPLQAAPLLKAWWPALS